MPTSSHHRAGQPLHQPVAAGQPVHRWPVISIGGNFCLVPPSDAAAATGLELTQADTVVPQCSYTLTEPTYAVQSVNTQFQHASPAFASASVAHATPIAGFPAGSRLMSKTQPGTSRPSSTSRNSRSSPRAGPSAQTPRSTSALRKRSAGGSPPMGTSPTACPRNEPSAKPPAPGQTSGSRAGSTIHSLPAEYALGGCLVPALRAKPMSAISVGWFAALGRRAETARPW